MFRIMKKLITILFLTISLSVMGQDQKYKITQDDYINDEVEMADIMRQNGKIYVVVGVILIIFAGITWYLYKLDRRITVLEMEDTPNTEA